MNRRLKMVIILVIGIIVVLAVTLMLWDGVFLKTEYNTRNDRYDNKSLLTESQFLLIQAGIQAASSHNMQPWKIEIKDQLTFSLYADKDKSLPIIDPSYNQMLISQGTFICAVKDAAIKMGIKLKVTYHQVDMTEPTPLIATFHVSDAHNVFDNKGIDIISSATAGSDNKVDGLEYEYVNSLIQSVSPDMNAIWISNERRREFQELLRKGVIIESENKDAMDELLDIFRFTKWTKNKYRYGLSLNTMSPKIRTFIEPIVGATSNWKSFGSSSIPVFEQRLVKEEAYLILTKNNPQTLDYIKVGEVLTALGLGGEGYTLRPAVQLLQPLEGVSEIYNELADDFGVNETAMLILGFTKKTNGFHESIRHKVEDIIMKE